jgi:hypothetical protein
VHGRLSSLPMEAISISSPITAITRLIGMRRANIHGLWQLVTQRPVTEMRASADLAEVEGHARSEDSDCEYHGPDCAMSIGWLAITEAVPGNRL